MKRLWFLRQPALIHSSELAGAHLGWAEPSPPSSSCLLKAFQSLVECMHSAQLQLWWPLQCHFESFTHLLCGRPPCPPSPAGPAAPLPTHTCIHLSLPTLPSSTQDCCAQVSCQEERADDRPAGHTGGTDEEERGLQDAGGCW